MRVILGCPISTRIISMQWELNLPPLVDYIKQSTIFYGAKLAKTAIDNPVVQNDERYCLQSVSTTLKSLIKGDICFKKSQHPKLFHHISMGVRKHNVNIFGNSNINLKINPCHRLIAKVHIAYLYSQLIKMYPL